MINRTTLHRQLYFAVALLLLYSVVGLKNAASQERKKSNKGESMLESSIQVTPVEANLFSISFVLKNSGKEKVHARYHEPFVDFALEVSSDGNKIPLVQPPLDLGLRPAEATIKPGASLEIKSPIRLRFNSAASPSEGPWWLWSIKSEGGPVLLRAHLRLQGASVAPCEATLKGR